LKLPDPPPVPKPIVRPRVPVTDFPRLVVIHLHDDVVYREDRDETCTVWDWVMGMEDEPPALVACQYAGRLLEVAHLRWQDHQRWQFKVAPVEDTTPDGENSTIRTLVAFFGFAGKVEGAQHRANRYFHCLDPLQFGRTGLQDLGRDGEMELATIYRWASEVRDFCIDNSLKPSTTRGGIAKQLLRDPRFYPEPRRKVPKATNDRVREYLPGNHYELEAEPHHLYAGLYLDQTTAHHTIAADIPLPSADELHARGFFHSLKDRPWAKPGTKRYTKVTNELGLLFVRLYVPTREERDTRWFPPWAAPVMTPYGDRKERMSESELSMCELNERLTYIYTNELRLLGEYGCEIRYVIAAWTTPHVDSGIRHYANWARNYLRDQSPTAQGWLKPTLLTVYGMLATRPRAPVAAWWRAKGGRNDRLPIGRSLLPVQIKEAKSEGEPSTNNVLQRGMIEAEMRMRSLELARDLERGGHKVLAIYADAVMVESRGVSAFPLMPGYWRPKGTLNLLRFLDETHFTSREMVRLPGVRRDSPARRNVLKSRVRQATEPGGSHGNVRLRPGDPVL
jgi:hypothetical protein